MCLCGMLAAGYDTLPESMRSAVVAFFDANESWLARVLEQGAREGSLEFADPATVVAQSIISGLEGALLIARPYGDVARFDAAANRILASLVGADARAAVRPSRAARRIG
jgi:TetR/AcrR family transcriptional repressor of nem operon